MSDPLVTEHMIREFERSLSDIHWWSNYIGSVGSKEPGFWGWINGKIDAELNEFARLMPNLFMVPSAAHNLQKTIIRWALTGFYFGNRRNSSSFANLMEKQIPAANFGFDNDVKPVRGLPDPLPRGLPERELKVSDVELE